MIILNCAAREVSLVNFNPFYCNIVIILGLYIRSQIIRNTVTCNLVINVTMGIATWGKR